MSSILSEIEETAGQLKLKISDLKPTRVKREEYNNRFSVTLTIDSKLVDIMHFLHLLQQTPHLFQIQEVYFEKSAMQDGSSLRTQLVLEKIYIP